MDKQFFTVGCCGLDCGLCPRFYTQGSSRCPGCCGECSDFPCPKFDRETGAVDSFVTLGSLDESLTEADKVVEEQAVEKEDIKNRSKILREILDRHAVEENQELKLRRG